MDLMLRCTWSFKLSPHLDHFNDLEGGIFVMELLEVLRRWIWIFFRVETEWGKCFCLLLDRMSVADFRFSAQHPWSYARRHPSW
jgi:hypothetical protein